MLEKTTVKNDVGSVFLFAVAHVHVVRRSCLEVILATMRARHGVADLVHGAQVEHEVSLLLERSVAARAHYLKMKHEHHKRVDTQYTAVDTQHTTVDTQATTVDTQHTTVDTTYHRVDTDKPYRSIKDTWIYKLSSLSAYIGCAPCPLR